jgi:hypothetical protein
MTEKELKATKEIEPAFASFRSVTSLEAPMCFCKRAEISDLRLCMGRRNTVQSYRKIISETPIKPYGYPRIINTQCDLLRLATFLILLNASF